MAKKWTLQNAVKKFKPYQKKSLDRNNGNLNVREFESLIKEMKCYYEVVEVEGKGRDRIILTDKKRKEKDRKEDKRKFNKGTAPPHSKHLALMIMSRMNNINNIAMTRNGWATHFGVISPAERDIMKGIYSEEALKLYKAYMIELGIIKNGEGRIFQDLTNILKNVVWVHLQTVLDQAEKLNLIRIMSLWKGKAKNSREPLDIDNAIAKEIKKAEGVLLKKHGINKWEALNLKNAPRVIAFNTEWLEYLGNVEDEEGDAMLLQYIYEELQIEVLNQDALGEFIKAHYPSETDSFNLLENEQLYHSKLLDYVVENAQKRHEKILELENKKLSIDEKTKKVLAIFNMTEDDFIAQNEEMEMRRELMPYEALLKSDKYVDCIRKVHLLLHSMNVIDSAKVKRLQKMNDEQKRDELTRLELLSLAKSEIEKGAKNEICQNDESSSNAIMEQQEEPTKEERSKKYENYTVKETVIENNLEKRVTTITEPNIESSNHYHEIMDDEYLAAMEDIRDEIRDYEEKYGDKAMEYMRYDLVIRELTREVTVEDALAEVNQKLQREKEIERKKWDKLFEGGQHVKRRQTSKNPLELFQRIRNGHVDKENP